MKCLFFLFYIVFSFSLLGNEKEENQILKGINSIDFTADSNLVDSIKQIQRKLKEAHNNDDSLLIAKFSSRLANAYYLIGNYAESIQLHKLALNTFIAIGNDTLVANEIAHLADAYYFSNYGEHDKALAYYNEAFSLFKKLKMNDNANYMLNNSAHVFWAKGDKNTALEKHLVALKNFEKTENLTGIAFSGSDVGFTLNSLERYNEAEAYHLLALDLERQLKDTIMMIPTLANLGKCFLEQNKLPQAQQNLELSLALAQKRNLAIRIKEATANLAKVYERQGKWKDANAMLQLNLAVALKLADSEKLKKLQQAEFKWELEAYKKQHEAELAYQSALANEKLVASLWERNSLIFFVILLLFFTVYFFYNSKRVKGLNAELLHQKQALQEKNTTLETTNQQLNKANTALIQTEKLATIGMLADGLSHEINNPLNFIQSSVETLQEEQAAEEVDTAQLLEKVREVLPFMQEGVQRISKVVRGLNEFNASSKKTKPTKVDIVQTLSIVLALIKPRLKHRITITTTYTTTHTEIIASSGMLHQLFAYIIFNAIEAIENTGAIDILIQRSDVGNLQVAIKDTGCGIAPNNLSKVFDFYYTTKVTGNHNGVGLTLAQSIVQENNATISIASQLGQGTEVVVDFK